MERTENTITLIIKVKKTDEAKKTVERLMLDESIISIMSENDELIKMQHLKNLQTSTETTATLSKKLFLC